MKAAMRVLWSTEEPYILGDAPLTFWRQPRVSAGTAETTHFEKHLVVHNNNKMGEKDKKVKISQPFS